MHKTTTTTLALVALVALVGIGVPVQAQVNPDCDHEFEIKTGPPTPRSLSEGNDETGRIEVGGSKETVRVELLTVGTLDFGVFVDDSPCQAATSSESDCDDDQSVETINILDPQHVDCIMESSVVGYFQVVNNDDEDHQYNIWIR